MWRARVPIGAFLGGWLAGQYKQEQRSSISSEYFEYACPESERVEVEYRWPWDLTSEGEALINDNMRPNINYT